MTEEPLAVSQPTTVRVLKNTPPSPLLSLSSSEAGWEGLRAQAFHEPMEMESWITPALSDISLVLFAGGVMRLEQRHANGPWKTAYLHSGDLMLRPVTNASSELRWKVLSGEPMQTLILHVSQDLLERVAEEVADYDPRRLSLGERLGFEDPLLTQLGFALWRELAQRPPAGKLYAQTAAQMLTVHLLRHYTCVEDALTDPSHQLTPQQIRRVMDFVQAYLSQDLSLESLAQQAGLSPYHFARLFRQTMGESPHQFVMRQRIERAQRLLNKGNAPLVDVAVESGFANQSHFTRVFKRYLGLTPHAYRQNRAI